MGMTLACRLEAEAQGVECLVGAQDHPKPYHTPRDLAIPGHPERRPGRRQTDPDPMAKASPQNAPSLSGHWTSAARQRVWVQSGDRNHPEKFNIKTYSTW